METQRVRRDTDTEEVLTSVNRSYITLDRSQAAHQIETHDWKYVDKWHEKQSKVDKGKVLRLLYLKPKSWRRVTRDSVGVVRMVIDEWRWYESVSK